MTSTVALTDLVGRTTRDADGTVLGALRDLVVVPLDHPTRVAYLVVRTRAADWFIPADTLASITGGIRLRSARLETVSLPADAVLLLQRDLLDKQIIDVQGRKVVRVNDVELDAEPGEDRLALSVRAVDVGNRGALRRIAHGIIPGHTLRALLSKIPTRVIPWNLMDLVESDPARRVKLKIAYKGLSTLHPADIADIVEDLAPAEREAVIAALDEDVAADTLEELDRDMQVAIVESLDSDRAADIVEEMAPDAAADLLGDLPESSSGAILKEMEPQERQQLRTLLEFGEHTAAGRMTTEYFAMRVTATSDAVVEALRTFEGGLDTLATIYLTAEDGQLAAAVPLATAMASPAGTPLAGVAVEPLVSCPLDMPERQVAELFDKYNLLTLPVVDEHGRLAGIITADDVITLLRGEH
jgi:magnesium transporter